MVSLNTRKKLAQQAQDVACFSVLRESNVVADLFAQFGLSLRQEKKKKKIPKTNDSEQSDCNRTHHSYGIPKASMRNNFNNAIICMSGWLQTKICHLKREVSFKMLKYIDINEVVS